MKVVWLNPGKPENTERPLRVKAICEHCGKFDWVERWAFGVGFNEFAQEHCLFFCNDNCKLAADKKGTTLKKLQALNIEWAKTYNLELPNWLKEALWPKTVK